MPIVTLHTNYDKKAVSARVAWKPQKKKDALMGLNQECDPCPTLLRCGASQPARGVCITEKKGTMQTRQERA